MRPPRRWACHGSSCSHDPNPAKPEPKGNWRIRSHFFEQEVTEGTEELRANAPPFIAEIARCFRSKGSSSTPPFGILRFLLFK